MSSPFLQPPDNARVNKVCFQESRKSKQIRSTTVAARIKKELAGRVDKRCGGGGEQFTGGGVIVHAMSQIHKSITYCTSQQVDVVFRAFEASEIGHVRGIRLGFEGCQVALDPFYRYT